MSFATIIERELLSILILLDLIFTYFHAHASIRGPKQTNKHKVVFIRTLRFGMRVALMSIVNGFYLFPVYAVSVSLVDNFVIEQELLSI